jgi:hypothetical protein
MALTIIQVRLTAGEEPVCGIALRPYIVLKRNGDGVQLTGDDIPEEGTTSSRLSLRIIWYRSVVNKGGACCWVHPDREATLQVSPRDGRKAKTEIIARSPEFRLSWWEDDSPSDRFWLFHQLHG